MSTPSTLDRINKLGIMVASTRACANWSFQSGCQLLTGDQLAPELRGHAFLIKGASATALYGLALELALKLLIESTTRKCARRIHDLVDLFDDLPTVEQQAIETEIADIRDTLERYRSAFEDWRYFHDSNPKNNRAFMDSAINAVLDVLAARHALELPNWHASTP